MEFQVNQEVVVVRSGSYDCTYIFATVERVTPSGQVVVKLRNGDTMKFKNGREMGSDSWRRAYLHTDVEAVRKTIADRDAKWKAAIALNNVKVQEVHRTWSRDTMLATVAELKSLVAAAEEAVLAIPV